MSTLLLEQPPVAAHYFGYGPPDPDDRQEDSAYTLERVGTYDALTLDDLVTGVWEGLAARATVSCPVCTGPITSGSNGLNAETRAGVCRSCGSRLS